jgi:hypothetical protein
MPPTDTFPLVNRIVGGDLHQKLLDWRDELSFVQIRDRLRDEFGEDCAVSTDTLRRWHADAVTAATRKKAKTA